MTPQETSLPAFDGIASETGSPSRIVSATRIKREQLEAFESGDLTVCLAHYARAWIRVTPMSSGWTHRHGR